MVRMINPVVERGDRIREGKGFSVDELKAVELTPSEAVRLGIPVDKRRGTSHEENVETLKEYLKEAKKAKVSFKKPKQTGKPHIRRVHRGRTSSGQKARGLSRKK
ncbi:MAG: ribosomal protein L13e [Candidatus Bathyarchaeota archaeon]|nr:ribosomal protein L13e [Candidatus Bathyarchaeota archaeon]